MLTVRILRNKRHHMGAMFREGDKKMRVGILDKSQVMKAIWNHYGTQGGGWGGPIPERPWIAMTLRERRQYYKDRMRRSAKRIFIDMLTLTTALERLGVVVRRDMRRTLIALQDPPNSPVTIEKKGSANPLVETGKMRDSHEYEISDG